MIPTRLELKNIGAIPAADIDLRSVDLAAVVGPNGVGKSTTFTFAPLWALFGSTKNGCSPDDMVRLGSSDAAVSIEFDHRGELYRVTRTRSTNGRGKSSLELQRMNGNGWEPLSGATIRETEEKIRNLLGLDEETFTSSSMILQGRSNEFTAKAPGQRKAILAEILGLSVYEDLQAAAKAKASALQNDIERVEDRIRVIDEALQEKAGTVEELEAVKAEIRTLQGQLEGYETALKAKQEELAKAKAGAARASELRQKYSELQSRSCRIEEDLERQEESLRVKESVLADEARILAKAAEYDEAKEKATALVAKLPRLESLRKDYARVDAEAKRLKAEAEKLATQKAELEAFLQDREAIEKAVAGLAEAKADLEKVRQDREALLVLEKQRDILIDKLDDLKKDQARQKELLDQEIKASETKAKILADAKCVDPGKAEISPCLFLQDAVAASKKLPDLKAQREGLPTGDPDMEAEIQGLNLQVNSSPYSPKAYDELCRDILRLEPISAKAPLLEAKAEILKTVKESELGFTQSLANAMEQMEELAAEGKNLRDELAPLDSMKEKLPELKKAAEARDNLPVVKEQARVLKEQIEKARAEGAQVETEKAGILKAIEEIDGTDVHAIEIQISGSEDLIKAARKELEVNHSTRGGLETKLQSLEEAETERSELWSNKAPKASELTHWQTLTRAFGRDGIPALIIENAVPELERISNEILGQMSNGQHSLRFETQRELKSKAGMAETLDIVVSDWMGARPYETFSGGEQLRIDLAIRFALSELLANRAGSKIEAVVIDEALASQDSEHKELVLEAVRSIKGRFRQILIITHLEDVKDAFGQQIRFERNGENVEVTVS
jgi:exonuclease SbcC